MSDVRTAPARSREVQRRRTIRWVVAAAALLAVAAGAGLVLVLPARGPLLDGRDAMLEGRDRLLDGDAGRAAGAFADAEDAFARARGQLGNPLTRLVAALPWIGRTPDAVIASAEAGGLLAQAGQVVAAAAAGLPGGPAALAPRNGVIKLEPFRALAAPLGEARDLATEADDVLAEPTTSLVPGVVVRSLDRFRMETEDARRALVVAAAVARALPPLLGDDGPKRYLVGAQTPAELRGTGGLIGSYAILEADQGKLTLGQFRRVNELTLPEGASIEPPSVQYVELYGANYTDFSNINLTPDLPTAAVAMERLYAAVTGRRVDGVILADPQAVARLMRVTGPVEVSGTGRTVDEDGAVPFLTNEVYGILPKDDARTRVLGDVAVEVLRAYLRGTDDPIEAGRAAIDATAGGHLLVHSSDPEVEAALRSAGVAGELADPPGDYVAVVLNNAGANKIDYYARGTLRYDVTLLDGGSARAHLRLDLENHAPRSGQPAYVIGPHPATDARPGDNLMIVQAYCSSRCSMERFHRDDAVQSIRELRELGHPMLRTGLVLPSGGSASLGYDWTTGGAWSEEGGRVVYRLTVQSQPMIRPTALEVSVEVPAGADVAWTSPGMRTAGGSVVWSGQAGDRTTLEVAFAAA